MNGPDPVDGTASLAVHGDPGPTPDTGVPVHPSPPEAPGPASRAPERDEAPGPRSVSPARSGDQAAEPAAGLSGQAARDAIKAALAEQGRRQRAQRGRYTRVADRAAGAAYKPGGNRRGGRQ